ncbi:MAG: flagellin [Phycisphaerales bacterium]|nr:flagellin [Phycisphaerales bacterium]
MSRINTNIQSLIAQRVLTAQNRGLDTSLNRLSTGLRINVGKDDPAGLIASETLRAEKTAINAALTNISRANNVIATAEGGLIEVNSLLVELEELVDHSANEAGISDDERRANQLQIDAILSSINRIANSTEFQGKKLLSGELDYTTSGVAAADFTNVDILGARLANNATRAVVVEVTTGASAARLVYSGSATGTGTTTIEVSGNQGTEVFSFASGTAIATVATAVNEATELTGVSATISGTSLVLSSTEFGSSQFVSVNALTGTFATTSDDPGTDDHGVDAVVFVNGVQADVRGLNARLQSSTLNLELDLSATFGGAPGTRTFHVTGGGADFAIAPTVNLNGVASFGVSNVATSSLGKGNVGFLSSLGSGQANSLDTGNYLTAQRIVRLAQTQVSELRGRIGAFQKNTLETTANSLLVSYENTTAAESSIRDTDFAFETSQLTRAQILAQSATNTLRLANQQPQQALALLG